jgi:hypothetical protein
MAWNLKATFDYGATYDYCRVTFVSTFARAKSRAPTSAA